MGLIKFSYPQREEASALLKSLAERNMPKVDVTDELVDCTEYYHSS